MESTLEADWQGLLVGWTWEWKKEKSQHQFLGFGLEQL